MLAAGARVSTETAQYLRNVPELDVSPTNLDTIERLTDEELASATPSVRHLSGALLVDLALSGDDLEGVRQFEEEAKRLGVAEEFTKILTKATARS